MDMTYCTELPHMPKVGRGHPMRAPAKRYAARQLHLPVKELVAASRTSSSTTTRPVNPFAWTKPADVIIVKATSKQRTTFVKK